MKKYKVTKFKCGSLQRLNSSVVVAESLEAARVEGEKILHCNNGEFIGAEAI
jgi:hypothetical protein